MTAVPEQPGQETPGIVLNAVDKENHQFIDILIENEQKIVISEYVVQVAFMF